MDNAVAIDFVNPKVTTAAFSAGHSAEILPFPAAQPMSAPYARLSSAAQNLHQAILDQQAAISKWRASLDGAKDAVQGLESSMSDYQRRLAALDFEPITKSSLALVETLDKAISRAG